MDYNHICTQTQELARIVGAFIKKEQNKITSEVVETKGLHDYVTYVDKTAEKMIVEELKKIVPEAGFITEEGTETKQAEEYNWIVDPLDGTTNFIHGFMPFSVSIALKKDEKIIMGVVYEISQDECFYAWENSSAYLNDKEIKTSEAKKVKDSLIATGFPYHDFSRLSDFLLSIEHFIRHSHGLRRPGSAATDLVYVACGRFDAFYEYTLNPWDVAAGAFILQQAGGKVCDFSGGDNYLFGEEIVASNAFVFDEFSAIVKDYMMKK